MFRRMGTTRNTYGKMCIIHHFFALCGLIAAFRKKTLNNTHFSFINLTCLFLASLFLLVGCGGAESYWEDASVNPDDVAAQIVEDNPEAAAFGSEAEVEAEVVSEELPVSENLSDDGLVNIVTTIFPLYDWTREILGLNPAGLSVKYLLESGVDLHNYTPSIQDIAKISSCDLFLWVGGKSDDWVLNAMANPRNEERRNVPVMRLLTIHETRVFPLEGVVPGEVGGIDCCGGATHDEHVWLSLVFAMRFVERIGEEIAILDPGNADYYLANTEAYIAELYELHNQFIEMVSSAARDTILVVDRFPFLYLTIDYDLDFFSAFDGCFAATEISLQRQAELANAVNDLELDVIIIIDNLTVAQSVAGASARDVQILSLEDFQTVSSYHIEQGMTYLDGMRHNLEALRVALG